MIRTLRAMRFPAVAAALLLLPALAAPGARADGTGALRDALDQARREAAELRRGVVQVQMSSDAALQLNRRIDSLERLIQRLTDKIDTLDARQRDLGRDFERYKNDTDFRISQIEKGARPTTRPPGDPPADRRTEAPPAERRAAAPPPAPPRAAPPRQEAEPRAARRDEPPPRAGADADRPRAGGSARDEYDHALGLLRRADYKGAEAALLEFVRRHPSDALAANAYYWLGENYYAQGRFRDAAFQFADGFRKFPNHPKAQDSLFKLAMSLGRQGKISDACAAFGEYRKRFPTAGLRREAEAEQRRMNCPG